MRPVLAALVELAEQFHLVELVVTVGVADAVKPAALERLVGDHYIKAVEREQALRVADLHVEHLHLRLRGRCPGGAA